MTDKPEYDLGKSSILQEVMYCVCGFSAHSGNKLAKHLGTNGCRSVYPSLEEAERARNIPEGQEDNFFIYSRNTEAQQPQEGSIEEEKQTPGGSVDEPVDKEKDKMDTGTGEKEVETEASEEGEVESPGDQNRTEEEGDNDEDKQPGPGGLLFGTLFNYMGDKGEGEGEAGAEDTVEAPDKPTPVEEVETVEDATK